MADKPGSTTAAAGLVTGINAVAELLASPGRLKVLYLAEGGGRRLQDLQARARQAGVLVKIVPEKALERLAAGLRHQGAVAEVAPFVFTPLEALLRSCEGRPALLLALDGVTDPRNLGAIIRSAAAAGADGLLLPERRSAGINALVAKTAAGALESLPIVMVVNLAEALSRCREVGFWVYGAAAAGGDDIYRVDWAPSLVLVLGSEDRGLRPIVARACDFQFTIPLARERESLNVGIAAAVSLFEIRRCQCARNDSSSR